jgi:hypothetical protein
MATETDYQQRITAYDHAQLLTLWEEIQADDTPGWEPGKAFEYLVIRSFELEGATVTYPFSVRLGGTIVEQIDGAIYSDGLACLVECKDQGGNLSIDPVAKLRNQMLRRPAGVVGLVFNTGGFTNGVKILARYSANQAILLWNGVDIECSLGNQEMRAGLVKKYRYCVERALPDYSLELEVLS